MRQKVIALVGLSGVGKTTFLKKVSSIISFQHMEASLIIKEQKEFLTSEIYSSEELRNRDIDDNQRLLIDGFKRLNMVDDPLMVLDGHTIIDTPNGLIKVPPAIFKEIGIQGMVFLQASPEVIMNRRISDNSRLRPTRSIDEINDQQYQAMKASYQITKEIGCPLLIVEQSQPDYFLNFVSV